MTKRKKTLSQHVVTVATAGLPEQVRTPLRSRWIARLLILLVPLLIATGVLQIRWNGNRPQLSVDRERAAQVRQEVRAKAEELKGELESKGGSLAEPLAGVRDRLLDRR